MRGNESATATVGKVFTKHLEGKIIETVYSGKITAEMAMQVRREVEPFLRRIQSADWLIDAGAATGIAPADREASTGVIELFRTLGGNRIAAVIPSSPIRMVVSALAFATGLPCKIFENRERALAHLRGQAS